MDKVFLCFFCTILFIGKGRTQQQGQITYIANEGVMVEYGETKVLIDALHRKYRNLYRFTNSANRYGIVNNQTPFDSIDMLLVTHVHGDHFHPEETKDLLINNLNCILVAPQQVIDTMGALSNLENQIYPLNNKESGQVYEFENLKIRGIPLLHSYQKKNYWVENVAYLLEFNDLKIIHIGDAELSRENLARIEKNVGGGVDYALLPDWYFKDEELLNTVKRVFNARKYIAMHVMITEKGSYERKLKQRLKALNMDLNVFLRVGEFEPIVE